MDLPEDEMRARVHLEHFAILGTADGSGQPHLVPVVYAFLDDIVWIAVDGKPKTTRDLKRLRNIAENPRVSLLVEHHEDDWTRLWWIRLDGLARILEDREIPTPISHLQAKYPQYLADPPAGPVIEIEVVNWKGWSAGDRA
jgi:PPOX class probable F420-dependent enzyme